MSTVVSVLQLQQATTENEEAQSILQDAAQRVGPMMLLYDKLYQSSEPHSMELDQYLVPLIKQVIEIFPHGTSIQLHTDIAPIKLEPKVLSELGIIVNELITNAMKYAFAGHGDGSLSVVARQEGTTVTISIADSGPGLPEQPSSTAQPGFGMSLVDAMVEQLNGKIRSESDNGTRLILEFDLRS